MPRTCGQGVDARRKYHGKTRAQLSTVSRTRTITARCHREQVRVSHDLSHSFHRTSPHRKSRFDLWLNTIFTQFPQPLLLQQRS
jgi:hypothetical protein